MEPLAIAFMAIVLVTSLFVILGMFFGEANGQSDPLSAADRPGTATPIQSPPVKPSDSVSEETALNAPPGAYMEWPLPTAVLLAFIGLIGAAVGSGGDPFGFLVAWALNPINWAMATRHFRLAKVAARIAVAGCQ